MMEIKITDRVLKKMFSSRKQEVIGDWRILHDGSCMISNFYRVLLG